MKVDDYASVLASELRGFLEYRRSLGLKHSQDMESLCGEVDTMLQDSGLTEKVVTKEIWDSWCVQRPYETTTNRNKRAWLLKSFCTYLKGHGVDAYVSPMRYCRPVPKYPAYIFTDDELKRFFEAVDLPRFKNAATERRDITLPVFFRILYTSGMRCSELSNVQIGDVNLANAVLTVHMGKNGVDRLVPFHPSLKEQLSTVLSQLPQPSLANDYVFQKPSGKCMDRHYIYVCFRRILEQAKIPHLGRGHGPRVHDFRHTYCVNVLRKWIDEKRDLMAWLPYLRTMLGHATIAETAYYLKFVASSFPQVRKQVETKFPDMFEDITNDEPDFY